MLAGYAVAMAWGIQSAHPRDVHSAWEQRADIARILVQLREEVPNRRKAYSLFMADKVAIRVKGLGPSYFTKLIEFFQPPGPGDRFIMDIWTARSVNLLTGRTVVLLAGSSPIKKNTPDHYDDFCKVVLEMAAQRGCTGDELEQMLFSVGGVAHARALGDTMWPRTFRSRRVHPGFDQHQTDRCCGRHPRIPQAGAMGAGDMPMLSVVAPLGRCCLPTPLNCGGAACSAWLRTSGLLRADASWCVQIFSSRCRRL